MSLPALLGPLSPLLAAPFLFWLSGVCLLGAAAARQAPGTRSLAGGLSVIWAVCIMHMTWSAGFCRSLAAHAVFKTDTTAQKGTA